MYKYIKTLKGWLFAMVNKNIFKLRIIEIKAKP